MPNIGVPDEYGDIMEPKGKGKGTRILNKTDKDFKYHVVMGTVMRMKDPSALLPDHCQETAYYPSKPKRMPYGRAVF